MNNETELFKMWLAKRPATAAQMRRMLTKYQDYSRPEPIPEGAPNLCRADIDLRDFCGEALDDASGMYADLVTFALALVDWTGVVDELRPDGKWSTTDGRRDGEYTEYQRERPTHIVIDWLNNDEPLYNAAYQIANAEYDADRPADTITADRRNQMRRLVRRACTPGTAADPWASLYHQYVNLMRHRVNFDEVVAAFKNQ